jgi:hypothetical protein
LLAQRLSRQRLLTRCYFFGNARRNHLLRAADLGTYQKGSTRSVPRLERLYDVVESARSALGKLRAHVCDGATELDLLRQRLNDRTISGLPGDSFVEFPIADGISFDVTTLQGNHGFNKYVFNPSDVAVAHLRDS